MYRLENASTYLDIDDYYVSFETGLPQGSYKISDSLSDGGYVSGRGNIGARVAKISRVFTRDDEDTRDLWLDWFTKPVYEELYLRKTSTNFDGIQRIYPALDGGESYKIRNFNMSDGVSFEMYMPDPYFESTTVTSSTFTLTSTSLHSTSISITGQKVFAVYTFIPTSDATSIDVKTAEGHGFHLDYNFNAGSSVVISTTGSNIYMQIGGLTVSGYFSANSNPFELWPGTNNLYITGSSGTLNVSYYERRL